MIAEKRLTRISRVENEKQILHAIAGVTPTKLLRIREIIDSDDRSIKILMTVGASRQRVTIVELSCIRKPVDVAWKILRG